MSNLDRLPRDVLRLILESVPISTIGSFSQTQQVYRSFLNDRWWERYFFRHLSPNLRPLIPDVPITREFMKEIGQYLLSHDEIRSRRLLRFYTIDLRSIYETAEPNEVNQIDFLQTGILDEEPVESIPFYINLNRQGKEIFYYRFVGSIEEDGWLGGEQIGTPTQYPLEMLFELTRDILLTGGEKYSPLPLNRLQGIRLIRNGEVIEFL